MRFCNNSILSKEISKYHTEQNTLRTKQLTYIDIHISDAQFYFVVFLVYTCHTKASKQCTSNETYCTNSTFTNVTFYNISGESFRRSHSLSCIIAHFCNFFTRSNQ